MDAFLSTAMVAVSAVTYDRPFRVLIVYDNDINRALLTVIRQLRDHSIVVQQACNTASRVFSGLPHGLLVLDLPVDMGLRPNLGNNNGGIP
jgi:hypothetical protein